MAAPAVAGAVPGEEAKAEVEEVAVAEVEEAKAEVEEATGSGCHHRGSVVAVADPVVVAIASLFSLSLDTASLLTAPATPPVSLAAASGSSPPPSSSSHR